MNKINDKVELDVNGVKDPNHDITYIGKATKMEDCTWRCLANVEGALCLVEVNIKPSKEDPRASVFCCSFCGKSGKECDIIISGPMVNICNECVQTANDILDDVRFERKERGLLDCNTAISFSKRIKIKDKFIPPPGEFSGCRCPHCPERAGTGECACCAERREEEKNPGPEPII